MQGLKNTLSALLASLKPKSDQLEIETYYQNSCGLSEEEIYNIVRWLTEAFLETGYHGRGHCKIVDFKHKRYKTLQPVPFCTYLGGYPNQKPSFFDRA
jgi:hypothetical protein